MTVDSVELEFLEAFVFALNTTERQKALGKLTPTSEEYFYFAILNEQLSNPMQTSTEEKRLSAAMTKQYGAGSRIVKQMALRRNILSYEGSNEARKKEIINFLRDEMLHLKFQHVRNEISGPNSSANSEKFPSKLDQQIVTLDKQIGILKKDEDFVSQLTTYGKWYMPKMKMEKYQLLQYINDLPSCTHPLTVAYILDYLQQKGNCDDITLQLSVEQLEQIAKAQKSVLGEHSFVLSLLKGQFGTSEEDLDTDIVAAQRLYEKFWNIAQRLPVSLSGTKSALMFECLQFEWIRRAGSGKDGFPTKEKFIQYLSIPQSGIWILGREETEKSGNNRIRRTEYQFDPGVGQIISQAKIASQQINQEMLIKELLVHFLSELNNEKDFTDLIRPSVLKHSLLEAQLLNGHFNSQEASSNNPECQIQNDDSRFIDEITKRVELTFEIQSQRIFRASDETVELGLRVKNIGDKLTVKMFEVSTLAYYLQCNDEIGSNIDLEGLVANEEQEIDFSEIPSAIRKRITIKPKAAQGKGIRGVFIVVVYGGGLTSRAVIRKGQLRLISRSTVDGHAIRIVDEQNSPVVHGAVWIDGKRFGNRQLEQSRNESDISSSNDKDKNDETQQIKKKIKFLGPLREGEFFIPYTTEGNGIVSKKVVITDETSSFSSLIDFEHLQETYSFKAGIFVEREELISFNTSHILIRPQLQCNGVAASVSLVESVSVTVTLATGSDGVATTKRFDGLKFIDGELTVVEVLIPEGLRSLEVSVQGRVQVYSDLGRRVDVSSSRSFQINSIDDSDSIIHAELRLNNELLIQNHNKREYTLNIFGKSGEAVEDQVITFNFGWNASQGKPIKDIRLMTDSKGEIQLGSLNDISLFDINMSVGGTGESLNKRFFLPKHENGGDGIEENLSNQDQTNFTEKIVGISGQLLFVPYFGSENESKMVTLILINSQRIGIKEFTKDIKYDNGRLILSQSLIAGDYKLFDWKTGRNPKQTQTQTSPKQSSPQILPKQPQSYMKQILSQPSIKPIQTSSSSTYPISKQQQQAEITDYIFGVRRIGQGGLSGSGQQAVGIANVQQQEDGSVSVDIVGVTPSTRVHAFARRFEAVFHPQTLLTGLELKQGIIWEYKQPISQYVSDKQLGTEELYILNRRQCEDRLGNTLSTPSVLLNPVVNKETIRHEEAIVYGDKFDKAINQAGGRVSMNKVVDQKVYARKIPYSGSRYGYNNNQNEGYSQWKINTEDSKNIDFLVNCATVVINQKPPDISDGSGRCRLILPSSAILLGHCALTIVATDDTRLVSQTIAVSNQKPIEKFKDKEQQKEKEKEKGLLKQQQSDQLLIRDMRLLHPHDPSIHFIEARQTFLLIPQTILTQDRLKTDKLSQFGQISDLKEQNKSYIDKISSSRVLEDLSSAQYETYNSLPGLIRLMQSICTQESRRIGLQGKNKKLQLFGELFGNFGELSEVEQMSRYSQFACHETHFFYKHKSPELFNRVIAPYLQCKKEKTLFDHLVLETHDIKVLHRNIASDQFQELNALEQILLLEQLTLSEYEEDKINNNKDNQKKKGQDISKAKNLCVEFLKVIQQNLDVSPSNREEETRLFEIALKSGLESTNQSNNTEQLEMNIDDGRMEEEEDMIMESNEMLCECECEEQTELICTSKTSGVIENKYKLDMTDKKMSQVEEEEEEDKEEENVFDKKKFKHRKRKAPQASQNRHFEYESEHQPKIDAHFRQVENTKEYRESQYYEYNLHNQKTKDLIPWNQFWVDYAEYILKPLIDENKQQQCNKLPFISSNIIHAHSSFTEVVMAIGASDVSITRVKPQLKVEREGGRNKGIIECNESACIVFVKETEEVKINNDQSDTKNKQKGISGIIAQEFFIDQQEPTEYDEESHSNIRKVVDQKELIVRRGYICEVVLTNTSPINRNVDVLFQIPGGSVPTKNGFYTRTKTISLKQYHTITEQYSFYFPQIGTFTHYPAQIASKGQLVAVGVGTEGEIRVVSESASHSDDEKSWIKVANNGSLDVVCKFLSEENLKRSDINLRDILWRLKDKDSFNRIVNVLHQRLIFNPDIWSYSLFHYGPVDIIREYLSWSGCGIRSYLNNLDTIDTPILVTDPVERNEFQIFEYRPLINARTFKTNKELTIANEDLKTQYKRFLLYLAHGGGIKRIDNIEQQKIRAELLDEGNSFVLVYYLLLQDRIEEAYTLFQRIPTENNQQIKEMQIQRDYLTAYFDFSSIVGNDENISIPTLIRARSIAFKYKNYPITRWRLIFEELETQLKEVDKAYGVISDEKIKESEKGKNLSQIVHMGSNIIDNAAEQELKRQQLLRSSSSVDVSFDIETDTKQGKIILKQKGGKVESSVTLRFHFVDLEVLFSTSPFVREAAADHFSVLKPNFEMKVPLKLTKEKIISEETIIEVPKAVKLKNAYVEAEYCGIRKTSSLFVSNMDIVVQERTGRIVVIHSTNKRPLPQIYIKVYKQVNNSVISGGKGQFVKDGFTDLRGCFDYASVSQESGISKSSGIKDRYAILVFSSKYGSEVREVDAPAEL
ncbi:MAG: putative secreted protein [Streblomastix strix]|uniref:Putative secreted protein n=1 Tax=Streblomastix strix TaxID=222440 RepID=A0A5J4X1X8_9EUKA|nr:MAG: putative secreted protein [Streblomastix strix]